MITESSGSTPDRISSRTRTCYSSILANVQNVEDDLVDGEDEFGAGVSKTDVREGAYLGAMRRPEIVAEEPERWVSSLNDRL